MLPNDVREIDVTKWRVIRFRFPC